MRRGRVFTPLVTGSTYRRGVYLLLGAVILLPYVLLGTAFAQMLNSAEVPRAATIMLLVTTIIIGVIPSLLRGARALEIAAVRSLLDVDLPDPAPNTDLETRLRGALWFGVHLIAGGIVGLILLIAVPLAVAYLAPRVGIAGLIIAGLVLLLAVVYAIAGMGKLAAVMAPVLLGPSISERIAALEAKADGRRVPIKLAVVPALLVAVMVIIASISLLSLPQLPELGVTALPMFLWPLWGVALAAAATA